MMKDHRDESAGEPMAQFHRGSRLAHPAPVLVPPVTDPDARRAEIALDIAHCEQVIKSHQETIATLRAELAALDG